MKYKLLIIAVILIWVGAGYYLLYHDPEPKLLIKVGHSEAFCPNIIFLILKVLNIFEILEILEIVGKDPLTHSVPRPS